tara:strand:- start:388 stop:651 length:264 start_codon:yes stop_codon:yes gene_type:complete
MSNAFQNAYDFVLSEVLRMNDEKEEVTTESILLDAEEALRDWDTFAGPRHTNYVESEYELTDDQWEDCQYAVSETTEARLFDKLVDS